MQNRKGPASDFFGTFVQITLNVLADTDVSEFEATVIDPIAQKVVQIQDIPVGLPHAQAVRERLSQFDLTRGPVYVAFRAFGEAERLYVGEVGLNGPYFTAVDIIGHSAQLRACSIPPYWVAKNSG